MPLLPHTTAQTAKPRPILITSGANKLAQALAAGLKKLLIRLTERAPVTTEHEFVECALGHDADEQPGPRRGRDRARCRAAAKRQRRAADRSHDRCTYNLLWAAAEEKFLALSF